MLDFITSLYDLDTFRFPLWAVLDGLGLDTLTAWTLDLFGYETFEDYSVRKEN